MSAVLFHDPKHRLASAAATSPLFTKTYDLLHADVALAQLRLNWRLAQDLATGIARPV